MNWTRVGVGSKPALFAAAAAAAGLLLTGCAAGQRAQTSSEIAAIGGASGQSGSLLIRNAGVAAPSVEPNWQKGSTAPLMLTIVNEDIKPVQLTSVTSSAASSVVLGTLGGAAPSTSSTGAAGSVPITVPGGGSVKIGFDDSGATVELTGLTNTLYPAGSVPVTFSFSNGSSISLAVPVNLTSGDYTAPTLAVQSPVAENG